MVSWTKAWTLMLLLSRTSVSRPVALAARLLCLLAALASAGDVGAEPVKDVQFWAPVNVQVELKGRWAFQAETQLKLAKDMQEVQNSLFRPSVIFRASPAVSITVGYAWVPYFYPRRADEHRLWEQVLVTNHVGRWTLTERVRLEQRFLPVVSGTSFRLRGQLKAVHPLSRDGRWQAMVADELLMTLNSVDPAPKRGLAANRLQAGLNRQVSKHVSVEPCYLLQYTNRASALPDEIDHVIQVSTTIRF